MDLFPAEIPQGNAKKQFINYIFKSAMRVLLCPRGGGSEATNSKVAGQEINLR